jgi:glutaredoxin
VVLVVITVAVPMAANGQIYKWVDNAGVTHFSDSPPAGGESSGGNVEVLPTDGPREPMVSGLGREDAAAPGEPNESEGEREDVANDLYRDLDRYLTFDIESPDGRVRPSEVELFITSWCPHCRRAREFLQDLEVPFVEYDIEKDEEALRRQIELTGSEAVPVALIGDKVIRGFSPGSYEQALSRSGFLDEN